MAPATGLPRPSTTLPLTVHSGIGTFASNRSVTVGIFVALLGKEFKTSDNMTAFAESVNIVVNVNDIPQFQTIIQRGVVDNDQFYRVFRQVLQEAGKR